MLQTPCSPNFGRVVGRRAMTYAGWLKIQLRILVQIQPCFAVKNSLLQLRVDLHALGFDFCKS